MPKLIVSFQVFSWGRES